MGRDYDLESCTHDLELAQQREIVHTNESKRLAAGSLGCGACRCTRYPSDVRELGRVMVHAKTPVSHREAGSDGASCAGVAHGWRLELLNVIFDS